MNKHIFLSLALVSCLSLQAMSEELDEPGGNAGSVSSAETGQGRSEEEALLPKKARTPWSRKKKAAVLAAGVFAGLSATAPALVASFVGDMVNIASPITAIPADVNYTGDEFGDEGQCNVTFPNISRLTNCSYSQFNSSTFPPDYVRGTCNCMRPCGCNCWIEKCEGADEFIKAYSNFLAALITGGIAEGLAIVGGITGLATWFAREND